MSVAGDESGSGRSFFSRTVPADRVSSAVVVIAALALLARLVSLGARVAGYREGRLGYRILRYRATGDWAFRPAGGSPLLIHVDRWLFGVAGPDDFVARLAVAVVGGCLPLAAMLFRDRLRAGAVVGVAVVLAASPAILFHSRTLSPVVPMAAFSIAAAGFGVRPIDRDDRRYAYPLSASVAVALGADETAIPVLGAGLLSAWLVAGRPTGPPVGSIRDRPAEWRRPVAGSAVLFLALVALLFAPRGSAGEATGLWAGVVRPWHLPGVLFDAAAGTAAATIDHWGSGPLLVDAPLAALSEFPATLFAGAPGVAVLAPVGILSLIGRSSKGSGDPLVRTTVVWGVLLLVGGAITAGSASIRAFVPAIVVLAVPAGVGVSALAGRAVDALRRDAVATGALLSLVLAGVALQGAAVTVGGVYRHPAADEYRLAAPDAGTERLEAVLDLAGVAVEDAPGEPDLLYYGSLDEGTDGGSGSNGAPGHPLPWYVGAAGATVDETDDVDRIAAGRPPVVVARSTHFETLAPHLGGYVAFPVELPRIDGRVIVFVRADRVPSERWQAMRSPAPAGS
ncbi:MAG: hypothetical protein ACI9YT_000710 [Halobacteriales archaeon]|jgi:uncharacterized protein (TIGR03663 family)